MEAIDRAREETGKEALYCVNVTSDDILESAQLALDNGCNCFMIDVITNGFPALSALSRNFKLPIHVHRTMHGAITRNRRHGIAMLVFARLTRLAGGDQLHVGCAAGKMEAEGIHCMHDSLKGDWYGLNTVFPVCSGGVHPGLVEGNLKALGTDIIIQAGGGVHGHPEGTRAGARAMMQAVEAFMVNKTLDEYAKDHKELARALERWGKTTDYQY
jgi:ribulose-bisphosphate carboxylase large chain